MTHAGERGSILPLALPQNAENRKIISIESINVRRGRWWVPCDASDDPLLAYQLHAASGTCRWEQARKWRSPPHP